MQHYPAQRRSLNSGLSGPFQPSWNRICMPSLLFKNVLFFYYISIFTILSNILKSVVPVHEAFPASVSLEVTMGKVKVVHYLLETRSQLLETEGLHVWPQPGRKKYKYLNLVPVIVSSVLSVSA